MTKIKFESLSAKKKDLIISSAKELLINKSIDELTSNEFIEHLGLSRGSFYLYFDNKEDLYEFLINDSILKFYNLFVSELDKDKNVNTFDFMNSIFQYYTTNEIGIKEFLFFKSIAQFMPYNIKEKIRNSFFNNELRNKMENFYLNDGNYIVFGDIIFKALSQLLFSTIYESLIEFYNNGCSIDDVKRKFKIKAMIIKNGFAYICHSARFFKDDKGVNFEEILTSNVVG